MNLSSRDKQHLWHPLTQHKTSADRTAIVRAKNASLFDENGNEYIDGIASWYTAMYGHCNDFILEKVHQQMQQLDHVVFSGFTHQPAVELSEQLIQILPNNQEKIFFSDNGSTSVDVAIKMAFQYHFNLGKKKKTIIALENGFHGDTFGAMSVSGLSVYNGPFEDFFLNVKRIPAPTNENIDQIKHQFLELIQNDDVAAFVYEPLVQGAAAMQIHDGEALNVILDLAKQNHILNIADEVMTGFGKTGTHFASEQIETKPDIICLSKALTAGFVPMAITSCTQEVYQAFLSDEITKGFFHGHTYSANPIACSAALAGIELLRSKEIQENIQYIANEHLTFAQKIKQHPLVKRVRTLGVIFALDLDLEMARYGNLRNELYQFFMENGVCLRPLGKTIYILPPYTIEKSQLNKVFSTIELALNNLESKMG